MEKTIFTQDQMYIVIQIWYGHDEIFTHIARGLVQTRVANGLDLDAEFIWEMHGYAVNGWCREKVGA